MIMKNEEKRLARCLESVRGLVNEIIIVDTGSNDRSIDIARSFNAHIYHHTWDDDFSHARNVGLRHARCDWILILDPDEVVSRQDHQAIKTYAADYRYLAYRFATRNYTGNKMQQGFLPNPNDKAEGKDFPGFVPSVKTRLFLNGLGVQFRGAWHELVDWDLEKYNIPIANVKTPIHHYPGEILQKNAKVKAEFYYKIGLKKVKEWPTNPQAWWELAVAQLTLKKYQEAAYSIARSMQNSKPIASRLFSLSRALRELKADDLAKYAFEKGICLLYPNLTHYNPKKKTMTGLRL